MAEVSPTSAAPSQQAGHHWVTRVALGGIVALGLFFRVWGITGESVWFDEFVSLILLKAPHAYVQSPHYERWNQTVGHQESSSLAACLRANRSLDPATMPAYPTFEYCWNGLVSDSALSLRLYSLFVGVLMIPLIFLFARDLFGNFAGLMAALCLAMSPVHRYYGQEIRGYVFIAFLALLSAWSFFHLLRGGGRRWWVLNVAANTLLPWTHVFGLRVPMVEGLFLLLFHLRDLRRVLRWSAVHALLFIPLAMYVQTLHYWSPGAASSWQKVPGAAEFFSDLLADDAAGMTHQIRATSAAFAQFMSSEAANMLVEARHMVGWAWMGAVLMFALWLMASKFRPTVPDAGGSAPSPAWRWVVFLLMWWLVPALTLYAASVLWRPCIFPRYTLHSSLALYIIVGGAIATICRLPVRIAAVCLVGGFFLYQDALVIGETQRPDWLSAAAHVRANAQSDDIIIVDNSSWKRVFAYNLGPVENVVAYGNEPEVQAEMCAFFLGKDLPSRSNPGKSRGVWAITQLDYFKEGPNESFEKQLAMRGLTFTRSEFNGFQHILAYRVLPGVKGISSSPYPMSPNAPTEFGELGMAFWWAKEYTTAVAACRKALEIDPRNARAYSYMGMAFKEMGERDAALEAFRKAVQLNPDDLIWTHVNMGAVLMEKGDPDGAIAAFRRAVDMDAGFAPGHAGLGKALAAKGEFDAAINAFRKAMSLDPNDAESRAALQDAVKRKASK